jgi:predicted permease
MKRGMTPAAARAAALERFGDLGSVRTTCTTILEQERRETKRRDWLDDLRQDVRFALRSALAAPLFSLLAVLTLALGLGANAAVFGVLKSVLLDALPYADAGRLVRVHGRRLDNSLARLPVSVGTVVDVRERQRSFASLAAFETATRDGIYNGDEGPTVLKTEWVEPALFRTLGARPALGRLLRDDDAASDTAFAIVITHATWQRVFGGDSSILTRSVRLNGVARTVVGVLARDFVGPVPVAEVLMPLNLRAQMRDPIFARRQHWLGMIGRLAPGTTVDGAQRDLVSLFANLATSHPLYNRNEAPVVMAIRDDMVGNTRTPLVILMASAGLVLVITGANLAGALLSRTVTRRKEFVVRVALGAGRGRLVRQLLTESAVLAVAGGAAGLLLAWVGLRALRGLALPVLPAYADLSIDRGAMLVTSVVAIVTGLAFGLVPALFAGGSNQASGLREEGRASSESTRSRRFRGLLVAGQIAMCLSLLSGAGLLVRSLLAMTNAPLGFESGGVLSVGVQLPRASYATGDARVRFLRQFEERLQAIPGVVSVASAGEAPTQTISRTGFTPEGAPPSNEAPPMVLYSTVSDDYFRTLGIPLRAGRTFSAADRIDSPMTIILNEGTARRFWPNGDAVGSRVLMSPEPDAPRATVIGVVGDVRSNPTQWDAEPVMYMSNRQAPWNGPVFLLRTRGDPLDLATPVRQALAEIDPGVPMQDVRTLEALLSAGLAGRRLPVLLMTAFGGLALLLASVGVYAMFASMAAAREREFGVRMALGASRRDIATLVLRQGATWMVAGIAAGILGVVAVTSLLRTTVQGVSRFDPIALGVALGILVVCAAIALLVPVHRATRADPISTLR